jgi:MFS family permease
MKERLTAASGSEPLGGRSAPNPWATVVVLCLGSFMILLDSTIVYLAVPSVMKGLNASFDQVLWVLNAYLLSFSVLLIVAGRLGDIMGPRNVFLAGLATFTVASAACGLAQDGNELIGARALQGVGGALLAPQALTFITRLFSENRRGAAFGVWSAVGSLGTVIGPTPGRLGGDRYQLALDFLHQRSYRRCHRGRGIEAGAQPPSWPKPPL